MKNITERYKDIVVEYCNKFAERHGGIFDENDQSDFWIQDSVIFFNDMYIDLNDIRYDVDNEPEEHLFIEWYDRMSECYGLGLTFPNYSAYLKGAPHPSDKEIEKFRQQHDKLIELKEDLERQADHLNHLFEN